LNRVRGALFGPALLAILLHLPAIGHDFVFDDRGAILENPLMTHVGDLPRLLVAPWWNTPRLPGTLYRPVTSASFAVDRALAGGFRPGWFHAVNVLLHGAMTWLVARLALLVLGSTTGALVAGLLFAVHPVHVEAVAGVVGRAEILAAGFAVAGLLLHRVALGRRGRTASLAAAAAPLAVLLAMLSKESALVAPALVWLLDRVAPSPEATPARRRTLYGAYLAAAAVALALRAAVLGGLGTGAAIPFVDNPAAAAGAVRGRLTALTCLVRYAVLLVWPARLAADYSFNQIPVAAGWGDPMVVAGLLVAMGVAGAGIVLLRRRSPAGFALLFVAIAMGLTSNLAVFIGTLLAERLMYLPSVGVCLLAGGLAARPRSPRSARVAVAVALAAAAAGAGRTWTRLPDWRDDFSLYRSAAVVSPRSARIRYNLGNAWLRRHDFHEAEAEYRQALTIYPAFADAQANLGMALLQQGRASEAIAPLSAAALRLPRDAEIAVNLGSGFRALGDAPRAEAEFRRALELDPGAATAWNNLGSLAMSRGDTRAALDAIGRAVALDPPFAVYHVNLGDALMAAGRKPEAVAQFELAARLDPGLPEARRGLGEAALDQGDSLTAEREFRAALEGDPPSARAANFLGYLSTRRGDARGAAVLYERALTLDPTLFDAHRSLGLLYESALGDPGRALDHFRKSIALAPDQPGADDVRRRIESLERRAP
jgi:tetratricopeptide (TPR) repeat protein